MPIKKGEIYLADMGDVKCADIGKIRPVLVFQNDHLNRMIADGLYADVVVIPLSSKLKNNDFTLQIRQRDALKKESAILCNAIKMIHSKRLMLEKGILTTLTAKETREVERKLTLLLDMNHK